MLKKIVFPLFIVVTLVSCQKEIDWNLPPGGGTGGGSTNGDLLVQALEITPATNDTNTITFQWDANKKLTLYKSSGKVNGINTQIVHTISRLSDEKIKNIISKSSATAGAIDSVVYTFYYTGAQVSYVIDTQYTLVGQLRDSISFLYNAQGKVSQKDSYLDFFGTSNHSLRERYQYDASGNLTTDSVFIPDGLGGFDLGSVATSTYTTHKNAVVLEEESYVVLGASNVSVNFASGSSTDASGIGGTSFTGTFSQVQYNSFDRPTQANLSVTPQPPGYELKMLFYYQ